MNENIYMCVFVYVCVMASQMYSDWIFKLNYIFDSHNSSKKQYTVHYLIQYSDDQNLFLISFLFI